MNMDMKRSKILMSSQYGELLSYIILKMSNTSENSADWSKADKNTSDKYKEVDAQVVIEVKNKEKPVIPLGRHDRFGKEIRRGGK